MKVSIVIPAYNEERGIHRTLRRTVQEIRSSGLEAEIVVVDNASTDRTAEVAGRIPSVRIVAEPVKGLSAARQRGYIACRGEIIVNLDADVLLPQGYLRRVARAFDRNPRLVCLSGPVRYHDIPQLSRIVATVFFVFGLAWNVVFQHVLRIGAIAQGGNFSVRRSALERIGGYDTSITFYGEDTDIARRLARVGIVRLSFRQEARASGRRLRAEGVFMTGYRNVLNSLFVIFYGRPLHRVHRDIRA